jgi:periodic tryptophan protein 2
MKLSYRLKRVCGSVYNNGNIIFTADGNSVLSPVGNRVTVFDLLQHTCITLPFESRKNIKRLCVSNNGKFLIVVDIDGHALFINYPRRVILHRFHFKRSVKDIRFSPNDEMFAVTFGHGCQIWKTPSIAREFSPLTLMRTIGGHHDDTICLDWSVDSTSIIMGSKDLSARIFYRVNSKNMAMTVLSGHRDRLVGTFFDKDGDTAFTVARDGAVFTWLFEYGDRIPIEQRKKNNESNNDSNYDSDEGDIANKKKLKANEDEDQLIMKTKRGGKWVLSEREFLWEPHTEVNSAAFNKTSKLLVVGFNVGVFGIYEMPGCVNIHKLSVSHQSLNTASINLSGEWIALGSSRLGQLLVWEWQSETYVLKQQGHLYGLNALDISNDGQYMATGGEDSKVKLWNSSSGFCFITFSEHMAPVTGVKFVGKGAGKAILSCSLDGTVRAYDLLRYKNFRTLTTSTPVQFTSLAVDSSGEVVCAGALDPFNIYVWSLQTGQLLDILAGHEGPIACLDFSSGGSSTLASGSWDGTLKLWDVYQNECIETMEHGCDVLAICYRPDGREICTATTNGNLTFWDVESGAQLGVIEGRRDISGGRLNTDFTTAENSSRSKHFTAIAYTADGTCILAGGRSKYACIYAISSKTLVKKFQLSHNRSLEGIVDELNSSRLIDGINLDNLAAGDNSDDEHLAVNVLPGSSKDGSRLTRPDILSSACKFFPTGREFSIATTQGLQVFSLDDAILFAPTDLDIAITPQAVDSALLKQDYSLAVNMALHLGEQVVLKRAIDGIVTDAISLVVKSIDVRMLRSLLKFLSEEIVASRHVEYYLSWCWEIIRTHGAVLQLDSMPYRESLRSLVRAISSHEKEILNACDENQFSLSFLLTQVLNNDIKLINNDNNEINKDINNKIFGEKNSTDVAEIEVVNVIEEIIPDKKRKKGKLNNK